ncbi:hypothetical protein MJO28_007144, partial [Puccinia striiformis f. sp. tritici]
RAIVAQLSRSRSELLRDKHCGLCNPQEQVNKQVISPGQFHLPLRTSNSSVWLISYRIISNHSIICVINHPPSCFEIELNKEITNFFLNSARAITKEEFGEEYPFKIQAMKPTPQQEK